MRLLFCLPWTLAVALHTFSDDDDDDARPVRKAFGPEHRNCQVPTTKAKHDSTIVGGHIVNDTNKYPFLAWLGDNDGTGLSQFCGGTLIHPLVVLTAAHCVYGDMTKRHTYARFRVANYRHTKGIERNIINWWVHEHNDPKKVTDDIALLLLDEEVSSEDVHPVQLSDGTDDFGVAFKENATIAGWGSQDEKCRVYDEYLRDAHIPIGKVDRHQTCRTPGSKVLRKHDMDTEKQLCAGYYKKNDEYPGCGDSGGPLLTYNATGDSYIQVGFVSWSYGIPWPDVFVRVAAYRDWIEFTTYELISRGKHPLLKSKPEDPTDAHEDIPAVQDRQAGKPAPEPTSSDGAGSAEAVP